GQDEHRARSRGRCSHHHAGPALRLLSHRAKGATPKHGAPQSVPDRISAAAARGHPFLAWDQPWMRPRGTLAALTIWALVAAGCAHYPLNAQQTKASGTSGYRFPEYVESRTDPADELFVCLSFSGGGTRAAAFAHGALLHLRDIEIGRAGSRRSLLDARA